MKSHFQLLAHYNRWMNERIYATASGLSEQELAQDRGAFFGSILGTLNHLMVADTIWLKRFANHPRGFHSLEPVNRLPAPTALAQILYNRLSDLARARSELDAVIENLISEAQVHDFEEPLAYQNIKGQSFVKRFGDVLLHFFNHQTHHRGQVSTLLFQAGQDVGATDLLLTIPDAQTR